MKLGDTISFIADGGVIQVVVLYPGDDIVREIERQTSGVKFRAEGSGVRMLNAEVVGSTYEGATPGLPVIREIA